ncbi:hypothetical protein IWQ57_003105, partial [Coemansia nantahalensis]
VLTAMFGFTVTDPNGTDTAVVCACAGLYGLTAVMLIYAWCNYKYRPIRAKNLVWVSLMYVSAILWFIGDIPTNGHVRTTGAWSICKLWVIWFRILFCLVFASLMIVRFYALDRVFNQRKPFTTWGSAFAFLVAVALCVAFCLVSQLISDADTVIYLDAMVACDSSVGYRIAAIAMQWVLWTSVGYLIFRLRNIQSSFNELRESIAIFVVVITLLIESTVTYIHYKYFVLVLEQRIQKTVMDAVCANLIIWLIMAHPVFMSIFYHRSYEQKWIETLARESHKPAPRGAAAPKEARCGDDSFGNSSIFSTNQLNYGASAAAPGAGSYGDSALLDPTGLPADTTLGGYEMRRDDESLPIAMRTNLQIQRPMLNNPALYNPTFQPSRHSGRRVL